MQRRGRGGFISSTKGSETASQNDQAQGMEAHGVHIRITRKMVSQLRKTDLKRPLDILAPSRREQHHSSRPIAHGTKRGGFVTLVKEAKS